MPEKAERRGRPKSKRVNQRFARLVNEVEIAIKKQDFMKRWSIDDLTSIAFDTTYIDRPKKAKMAYLINMLKDYVKENYGMAFYSSPRVGKKPRGYRLWPDLSMLPYQDQQDTAEEAWRTAQLHLKGVRGLIDGPISSMKQAGGHLIGENLRQLQDECRVIEQKLETLQLPNKIYESKNKQNQE